MFDGKKTYLAAIAAVLIALGYAIMTWVETDTIELQAVISACIALAILFLRKGIKKEG